MRRRLAATGLALLLALACAGPGLRPELRPGVREAYRQALATAARDPEQGSRALRAFVERYGDGALGDDAAYRLAQLEVESGARDAATRDLEWLLREHPDGDQADAARLLLARLQRERGLIGPAYDQAARIRLSKLSEGERREALRLLAELAGDRADAPAKLRWLAELRNDPGPGSTVGALDAEIAGVLAGLDDAGLEAAAQRLGQRVPALRVRLRQADLALGAGRLDEAAAFLAKARTLPGTPEDADQLAELDARLAARSAATLLGGPAGEALPDELPPAVEGTLGVVLPLSGPYAAFGEETLQGLLLAARIFGAEGDTGGVRLRVKDSEGDPQRAAAAVRALADRSDVLAVLGPLLAEESEAAGDVADEAGIPLIAFTRRASVGAHEAHVLRAGVPPEAEAQMVAAYATGDLGLHRFAILYPDNPYGLALRAAFWEAVEARGGEVVGVARYAPDATDFAEPIRDLIGFRFLTPAVEGALRERERMRKRAKRLPPEEAAELRKKADEMTAPDGSRLPPFVDFEALFIPDAAVTASLIAPHLAFHEVRGVRLLGTSGWDDPRLVQIGGRHVDGAVFPGGYFADSTRPRVAGFGRRFQAAYGKPPDYLGAQAYDAMAWLLQTLARSGARDRSALTAAIGHAAPYSGASGTWLRTAGGSWAKRPHLLGVDHGHVVSVDETGQPPYLRIPTGPEEEGTELPSAPAAAGAGGAQR